MASAICLKRNSEQKIYLLLMILVVGFSIHGILNSYMWYAGYAVPGTRRWPDFWSGGIVPGTQHAAYFIPAMVMFVPAVLYFRCNKIVNVIMVLLTAFFGYTSLSIKSRMSILIFAIFYIAIVIGAYKHVKEYQDRKKEDQ
jgi:hypothetical protein